MLTSLFQVEPRNPRISHRIQVNHGLAPGYSIAQQATTALKLAHSVPDGFIVLVGYRNRVDARRPEPTSQPGNRRTAVTLPEDEQPSSDRLEGVVVSKPRSRASEECVLPLGDMEQVPVRNPVSSVEVEVHMPRLQQSDDTAHTLHVPDDCDSSRPDTPSWDYFTETPLFEQQGAVQGWDGGACLPVANDLQLESNSRKKSRRPLQDV